MLQTTRQLSLLSRITSYSSSFHPRRHSSTITCGELTKARVHSSSSSFSLDAKPLPRPPKANAARTSTGYPIRAATFRASSMLLAHADSATFSPRLSTLSLNTSRSSVATMASICVPRTLTPYFARVPSWWRAMAQFSAVCPPKAANRPSGRTFSMTFVTNSGVTGKKKIWSARPLEVCTVAMFGLMRTDCTCCSLRALIAWLPE
mmetsp:Transcript_57060/g.128737  ORF Transcript_57060/g.128737 Transcript_57060/m.128737 type:complete len:205 (+) Transcript_57060:333-947(+)